MTPLTAAELPPGFHFGYRVSVPLMEKPTYLNYLADLFVELGGQFEYGELTAIGAIPRSYGLVVNCSGYGAGVVVLAEAIAPERYPVHDERAGTLTYVISRSGDCVLGGCDTTSDLLATSLDEAADIIRRCTVVTGARLKSVEVGIRPVRAAGSG